MMTRRVVCLLFVVFTISALAGEEKKEKQNSLHKGAWALQFEVQGSLLDFQLYDYLGQTFSGKYQLSDKRALRFGVELNGSVADIDHTVSASETAGESDESTNQKLNNQSYSAVCQYMWYLRKNNGFHFMVGLGPQMGFSFNDLDDRSKYDFELTQEESPNMSEDYIRKYSSYHLGLAGSIGFEYFITSNLSTMMEFQSNCYIRYDVAKTTKNRTNADGIDDNDSFISDKRTSRQFSYGSTRVKIGLSVYF